MQYLLPFLEFLTFGFLPADLPLPGMPGGALTLLVVAVGAALAWMALRGTAPWPVGDTATGTAHAMRRRSRKLPVLTLCDPDAAGRPRPRAPGAALPAAR
ncbi:hypothetical protein GCM10007079_48730 [Nocardiopsis terrae]|uniref:Uncharacterized protein n=1 Tax=Nocardiopsis terrae TaxID=372655 RepID=A0ABR9HAG0_9ACTN|nr:DUF6412 domain-containing protein [Nocardiopsis terrae]MBE1456010.1 hypothetical protein [Nocardiopsis terrae]GHC96279.1 hypothetical protein GCM10007079_48730 [Nocardiopsis terrae]